MKAIVSSVNYSHYASIYPKWRSGQRYRSIRRSTKAGRALPGVAPFHRTNGCDPRQTEDPTAIRALAPHAPMRTVVFSVSTVAVSKTPSRHDGRRLEGGLLRDL